MKIAVIAHDGKKADMVAFIMKRLDFFKENDLIATGTTGKHIKHAGLEVTCLIDGVVFFIDPMDVHPHQVDVSMLLRICNVYNIPLATNYMTASLMISGFKHKANKIEK
jgi:methylglyoxal synthase